MRYLCLKIIRISVVIIFEFFKKIDSWSNSWNNSLRLKSITLKKQHLQRGECEEMKCILWRLNKILLFSFFITSCYSVNTSSFEDDVYLNQIQVIGSHNSYKQAIQSELLQIVLSRDSQVIHLDYAHLPIVEQLNLGLRKIEIDIYHDPEGGRYAHPGGNEILKEQGIDVLPFQVSELTQPGFKVFHVQDVDFRSHCYLLEECLKDIKNWSNGQRDHIPLIITINVKSDPPKEHDMIIPLPFTTEVYDELDKLFVRIFEEDNIIKPSDIKGKHHSTNEGMLRSGWPSLANSRGKFLIVLDEPMRKINTYLSDKSTADRVMFVNAPPGHPASAFIIANDPIAQEEEIRKFVTEGYLVRTRADADTQEARTNDYTRYEAAKRSGAQFISTDYYYKTDAHPDFVIQFADSTYVRCNPVMSNVKCQLYLNKNKEKWDL